MLMNGMRAADLVAVDWVKSARSNSTGNCVQFAQVEGQVAVRDSKDPDGPALVFSSGAVAAFVRELKAGRYDGLLSER